MNDLKEKGFTNIKLQRSDDLKTGWKNPEGTIKKVTIGDTFQFAEEDTFYPDEPITIVVYTFKGRGCEDIAERAD